MIDVSESQLMLPGFCLSPAEKTRQAVATLQLYEEAALKHDPLNGYWGAFSGGKDSVVIKELARMAGVKVVWRHNVTTIDPGELYRFIRRDHPDVVWNYRPKHFYRLIVERGYPLRRWRWCCQEFKERYGLGRVLISGVRCAESPRRKQQWTTFQRRIIKRDRSRDIEGGEYWMVNPIVHWSDADVWEFIGQHNLPYCELYDEGFKRLGCVGCPMSGAKGVQRDFARWPSHERAWRRAFHRLWDRRITTFIIRGKRKGQQWPGLPGIETADELFNWWKSGDPAPKEDEETCQLGLW